jgi:hypothetical protein
VDRRPEVAVYTEDDRHGTHHLVRRQELVGAHEGLSLTTLVVRPGVEPRHVRAELRCASCWEALGEAPVEPMTARDRLAALGRQQRTRRRGLRRRG